MVHQHFRLVHPFTVAENVTLGEEGSSFRVEPRKVERRVAELSERYGLAVDPRARVWQLSLGEQQRVEILKALYRDAKVLILDEPTAVLTPQEAEVLFVTLRAMAAQGRTVIFISHKLNEVTAVSDRVTVLRGGKSIATVATSESTVQLARVADGRPGARDRARRVDARVPGEPVLELARRLGDRAPSGADAVRGVSLERALQRDRRRRRGGGQRPARARRDDRRDPGPEPRDDPRRRHARAAAAIRARR